MATNLIKEFPRMSKASFLGVSLAVLFIAGHEARAQGPPPLPPASLPAPPLPVNVPSPEATPAAMPTPPIGPGTGLEPESLPAEIAEDYLGATPQFRFGA